jgi:hypothetical protein
MSWIDKLLRRKSNHPGPDTSSKSVADPISRVEPSAFKYQVEEGGAINQFKVTQKVKTQKSRLLRWNLLS